MLSASSSGGWAPITRRASYAHPAALSDEAAPFRVPDFLKDSPHARIPATVTAPGYEAGMPVAIEAEETHPQQQLSHSSSSSKRKKRSSGGRRSTLPTGSDMERLLTGPPLLHSALTPSCELCSLDLAPGTSQPSAIFCHECDMFLCGSEYAADGVAHDAAATQANGAVRRIKPRGCNWRLHRHVQMQEHVRVAAGTHMQLKKLEADEAAKPARQRRSRKLLTLQLFELPMRGVSWQCQSAQDPEEWLEFDLLAQASLERAFGPQHLQQSAASSSAQPSVVQLSAQYRVEPLSGADGTDADAEHVLINTLTKRRQLVRRIDVHHADASLRDTFGRCSSGAHPNTRPSSATASPRGSYPSSPAGPHFLNGSTLSLSTSSTSLAPSAPSSTRYVSSVMPHPDSPSSIAGLTPLPTPRRPSVSRIASVDTVQMRHFDEWTPAQWNSFAEAQHAPNGQPTDAELFPLFDMERGDALLLAVYHNAQRAVEMLLAKGFSVRAVSSWTHLSSLQLAAMQGNDSIAALLLQHGADPAYQSQGPTLALEYAAKSGCLPLLRRLLEIRSATGARLSYSDIEQRDAARKSKRSTWTDIADSDSLAAQISAATAGNAAASVSPTLKDPDLGLYPHLLTEALNVPPIQAHSLDVVRFLLDSMLNRQNRAADPSVAPAFELSRYHEWMTACISSSSVARLRFMLENHSRYTRALGQLDSLSDVFEDHLTDERYARAVLRFQKSIDALLFQACTQHPASEELPRLDGAASASGDGDAEDDASEGGFALLSLLLDAGADVNCVLADSSDGTELTPLLMAVRDRKMPLLSFLVEHGADPERRQKCVLLELARDVDVDSLQPPVSRAADGRAYQMLLPEEFALDECAYDPAELTSLETAIELGVSRRHWRAQRLARVVLDVSRQMVASAVPEGDESSELMSPAPVALSPTAPRVQLEHAFPVRVVHEIVAACFGNHALTIGAEVSAASGVTLSRPVSPVS